MASLEADLAAARALDVAELAAAVRTIGFECTDCGACCRSGADDHTATVFPDEVRRLRAPDDDWRDVARPMPYGLRPGPDGPEGETLEWALQTDDCGDCTFYDGGCTRYEDRPLVCRTYPFSVGPLSDGPAPVEPMGDVVDREGAVRAHECEGLGRDISRADAMALARALKARAVRDLEEAIALRDGYRPAGVDGVVVHDSEGAKRPDGSPVEPG